MCGAPACPNCSDWVGKRLALATVACAPGQNPRFIEASLERCLGVRVVKKLDEYFYDVRAEKDVNARAITRAAHGGIAAQRPLNFDESSRIPVTLATPTCFGPTGMDLCSICGLACRSGCGKQGLFRGGLWLPCGHFVCELCALGNFRCSVCDRPYREENPAASGSVSIPGSQVFTVELADGKIIEHTYTQRQVADKVIELVNAAGGKELGGNANLGVLFQMMSGVAANCLGVRIPFEAESMLIFLAIVAAVEMELLRPLRRALISFSKSWHQIQTIVVCMFLGVGASFEQLPIARAKVLGALHYWAEDASARNFPYKGTVAATRIQRAYRRWRQSRPCRICCEPGAVHIGCACCTGRQVPVQTKKGIFKPFEQEWAWAHPECLATMAAMPSVTVVSCEATDQLCADVVKIPGVLSAAPARDGKLRIEHIWEAVEATALHAHITRKLGIACTLQSHTKNGFSRCPLCDQPFSGAAALAVAGARWDNIKKADPLAGTEQFFVETYDDAIAIAKSGAANEAGDLLIQPVRREDGGRWASLGVDMLLAAAVCDNYAGCAESAAENAREAWGRALKTLPPGDPKTLKAETAFCYYSLAQRKFDFVAKRLALLLGPLREAFGPNSVNYVHDGCMVLAAARLAGDPESALGQHNFRGNLAVLRATVGHSHEKTQRMIAFWRSLLGAKKINIGGTQVGPLRYPPCGCSQPGP